MVKTDDGFCCAFNTISVQSSYASEAGEDYDQAEYGDDYDYYDEDYDDEDYYYDYDTTTTESITNAQSVDSSSSEDGYSETCKSVFDNITKPGLARWYTGCYKNDEDKCFFATDNEKKDDHSPLTEKPGSHFETYPPKEIKEIQFGHSHFNISLFQEGKKWRTNAASKNLGLSILLDPMTHDNIKGDIEMAMKTFV